VAAPSAVHASARGLENAHLRVTVDDGGAILLEDLAAGRTLDSCIDLIDEADAGDEYTPAPRRSSHALEIVAVEPGRRGPLVADLSLHARLRDTGEPVHPDVAKRRKERGETSLSQDRRAAPTDVTIQLVLVADARWLRVEISGRNTLTDHRLRLRFRTDVVGEVWADAAFGPAHRAPIDVSAADAAMEVPPRTAPLHRYVSRFDDRQGCTVFSDGLAEYQATEDGAILVTLVRAIGALSVRDLPERPGHAGWPKETPGAQCLRPFAGSFALMLHGSRTAETIDAIERAADDILLPLRGTTLRSSLRTPPVIAGVGLQGRGLAPSAIKESEDGRWLVLRCVNLTDAPVAGAWRVPFDVVDARRARLDETPLDALASVDGAIGFEAAAREIVTILARRASPEAR
jgi:alpha-mannosidase